MPTSSPRSAADHDAALTLAEALDHDPFYRALVPDPGPDHTARRRTLAAYFLQSMTEGRRVGRVSLAGPDACAIWITRHDPDLLRAARDDKLAALARLLGPGGFANYLAMVENMSGLLPATIPGTAWYLSIMGVTAGRQGRGLGTRLLRPVLAEADRLGTPCYLETFSPRSEVFYARLGFAPLVRAVEPRTGAAYRVMLRPPDGKPRA